ncbi:hypothetical protein AALP_AA3G017500 [Arabis alpina]|uniref:RING-type E3 ubiquitin transferase n=1 Tax=Arabis alpina TaxID=50452 RepID=A0A087H6E8_ARAAL|nr:hypothetical protein AALP_AA3G017500 [Arabis alpina]
MASTKSDPAINVEEEAEYGGSDVEGEANSPLDGRDIDCNPYFPFSSLISDSESGSYSDSEPDPFRCPIDFFDRDSSAVEYLESEVITGDDFNIWGFYNPKEDDEEEAIVLGTRSGSGSGSDQQGLRVTGIDSDSDDEDDVFDFTENDSGRVEISSGLPPVWDYVFGEETILADEEWEEVQNAINLTVHAFSSPEEEEEEEELSSRDDDEEEHELDWQVLLAVNNVVNYIDQAEGIMINPGDIDPSYYFYLASLDEFNDEDHNDDIVGQMFDNEIGIRGNPPAAKSVVDDLPVVVLTVEELNNGNVVCAVCKDDMVVEEKVKRLPCMHLYHGECIMPWLGIRNTCPVCRFELPTDDLEYERHRRSQRSDISLFLTG